MIRLNRGLTLGAALVAALTVGAHAWSQHATGHPLHGGAAPQNMQGNDEQSWIDDPHMHAFYDLSAKTFAKGAATPDVAAYEQKAFAIFRDFGVSRGIAPDKMQDHLKLIPRQIAQIAKEDPTVIDNYKNFVAATFGPR